MRRITVMLMLLSILCSLLGCVYHAPVDITMPYSSEDYESGDWTLEELVKHFEELGFSEVRTDAEPSYFGDFENEIISVEIQVDEWDSDSILPEYKRINKGEETDSNNKILIHYYYIPEALTVDNCPELSEALFGKSNGETVDYVRFAQQYDGKYVKFDAYVYHRVGDLSDTDPILYVVAGDYSESEPKGCVVYIGAYSLDAGIDVSVEEGEHVRVYGKIDVEWSKYYDALYVETLALQKR